MGDLQGVMLVRRERPNRGRPPVRIAKADGLYPAIGAIIKRERLGRGWDQAELGRRLGGISHAAVSDLERGKTRPHLDDLLRIAYVLDVPMATLLKPALTTILLPAPASAAARPATGGE